MRIAIDAMGGDFGPQVTVQGALMAAKEWKDVEIILVGDESRITPLLQAPPSNVHIQHAEEYIESDEEPVKAVRRKKNSSMVVAGRMVKDKQAEAMISAGNTGALMATGLLIVGRIDGIDRPALAPMLPTMDGQGTLALDLGANMDASPDHLLQYAMMGHIYRKQVHGLNRPRIGLLNVGSEASKGNELTKGVYPMLEEASSNNEFHFVGNVEARDVLQGQCDVLVCDGFAGNILLKSMEGTAGAVFSALKEQFTKNTISKLAAAILKPGLKRFKDKLDYTEHGGAPLLGVNGIVIKSHGSSDANAIKNAVRQARLAIKSELVAAISNELSRKRDGNS